MTQAEYARHRKETGLDGGTLQAVREAIATGRITCESPESKLINPDAADRAWLANTDPTRKPAKAGDAARPVKKSKSPEPPDFQTSKANHEFFDSELARLKFEKEQGKLIPANIVRKVMFEAGRIIRAGHEDIVSQLAPDLAAETSINAVERILKTRLERLDSDLADRIEKLDELFDAVE